MDLIEEKSSAKQDFRTFSLILALLLGMVCLAAAILGQWNGLNQNDRVLPASLLAVSTEDYSGSSPGGQVQVIGLAIIGDKMKDAGLQPGDLSLRLASVTAELLSPVPSATANLSINATPTSTGTPAGGIPPHPTSTDSQIHHPTSTQAPISSDTPAASPTFSLVTATSAPSTSTVNPTPHPTQTSAPAPLPTTRPKPTSPPKHTPQPQPNPKHTPKPKKSKNSADGLSINAWPVYSPLVFFSRTMPDGIIKRIFSARSANTVSLGPSSRSTFFTPFVSFVISLHLPGLSWANRSPDTLTQWYNLNHNSNDYHTPDASR
jgi:hypothetical protein